MPSRSRSPAERPLAECGCARRRPQSRSQRAASTACLRVRGRAPGDGRTPTRRSARRPTRPARGPGDSRRHTRAPMSDLAWLAGLSPWPRDGFGLGRMIELLSALGDPQLRYPAVHVVGTNGKSTATVTDRAAAPRGRAARRSDDVAARPLVGRTDPARREARRRRGRARADPAGRRASRRDAVRVDHGRRADCVRRGGGRRRRRRGGPGGPPTTPRTCCVRTSCS